MGEIAGIPVVILAGGKSERFGHPKGLAEFQGQALFSHIRNRLAAQAQAPIRVNTAEQSAYMSLVQDPLPDELEEEIGPLAGLHAAMSWADKSGYAAVITVPVDTPLLPETLVRDLTVAGPSAIATSQGRSHPICGLWNARDHSKLKSAIETGLRAAHAWADLCTASLVDFPSIHGIDPFYNINTQTDLDQLSRLIDGQT